MTCLDGQNGHISLRNRLYVGHSRGNLHAIAVRFKLESQYVKLSSTLRGKCRFAYPQNGLERVGGFAEEMYVPPYLTRADLIMGARGNVDGRPKDLSMEGGGPCKR